eukprot:gene6057-15232_t
MRRPAVGWGAVGAPPARRGHGGAPAATANGADDALSPHSPPAPAPGSR